MKQLILDYLERTANPVQLVKHMDEVPESKIKYPLIGQKKYDGLYILVVVLQDVIKFYSRTGKEYYQELESTLPLYRYLPQGVYIGELMNDCVSLEVLSGYVSTNRKKQWTDEDVVSLYGHTYIMFHDFIPLSNFTHGRDDYKYSERFQTLRTNLNAAELLGYCVEQTLIHDREDADQFADSIIAEGGEGAVFKHDCDWEAGHKGYRAMKIVRGLHVDLLCVGVEYGKGKRSCQIAKLQFSYKGNVFSADLGKGWTDERREELTKNYELTFDPHVTHESEMNPIGKIWEVKALQESSTGKALRLPKVVRVREDKEIPDA